MKAILYIGHGTRSKKGAEEAKSFLRRVITKVDFPIQEISFLELTEPFIDQGFHRCVERGATEIVVIPLFLLAAGHIKKDIPEALKRLKGNYPHVKVSMRDPFGVQDEILGAVEELVRGTVEDVSPADSLLIVGRGSSDPSIHTAFAEIATGIGKRLGMEKVSVCYLAAASPRFEEGLETVSKQATGKVIVIPYLLFSGLLLSEVIRNVRTRQRRGESIHCTGPLTEHRAIENLFIKQILTNE
ncbi:sirohydrochlorin chelatase [Mesobacillus maritimus]|uniref:Sirohydrochlorin chelatase n=1 Tax=Mesobacillus maritimus TaxID=1643336 RepID=A0ABS7K8Q0_9BACI|nr:sirohydrochlorin chelatase [Mesobacillus maritimus]MBY0098644.1 sirohydrochlorin chelatase [Mesobacillus maritimus]